MTSAPRKGDVPLDLGGIAVLLDVHEATPKTWRRRGILPEPAGRIGRSDYWWQSTIEQWWVERRAATTQQEQEN